NGNVVAPAVVQQATKSLTNAASAADRLAASFDQLKAKVEAVGFRAPSRTATRPAPSASPVPQQATVQRASVADPNRPAWNWQDHVKAQNDNWRPEGPT